MVKFLVKSTVSKDDIAQWNLWEKHGNWPIGSCVGHKAKTPSHKNKTKTALETMMFCGHGYCPPCAVVITCSKCPPVFFHTDLHKCVYCKDKSSNCNFFDFHPKDILCFMLNFLLCTFKVKIYFQNHVVALFNKAWSNSYAHFYTLQD